MAGYKLLLKERNRKQILLAITFIILVIAGWFYPLIGYFIPICMLAGILIALFKGRKWCDWYCPRGSFFDAFIKILSPAKKIPNFFVNTTTRVLVISFMMTLITVQIVKYWPDKYKIGMVFIVILTATTMVGIILAIAFHQRTWCYICPVGSISAWIGKDKYPLKIDSRLCNICKICHKVCPIKLQPFKFKKDGVETINQPDCLKCELCVKVCPQESLITGENKNKYE